MTFCLFGRYRRYRHAEVPPDYAGDFSKRYALVADAVIPRSHGAFLKCESEEMRGVKPVHRRPAVESVTDIRRDALFAPDADERRNESVIALAMDGKGKSYRQGANAAVRQRERRFFRSSGPLRKQGRIGHVFFHYDPARSDQ